MKKPIAKVVEATYKELKAEFKNETPVRQLGIALYRFRQMFTHIKVIYRSLEEFLYELDTLSEKEEHELWAMEDLLRQHLVHLEGFIDGATKYFEEAQK